MSNFTEEQTELLIDLVRQYPVLYNLQHKNYLNNSIKENAWKLISETLQKPGAPPPTAYHLPSVFDENNCSTWVRPCTFDYRCGQCLPLSKCNDHSVVQTNKSSDESQVILGNKPRSCASCTLDNKENVCSFQKKDGSSIPRIKKNVNYKLTEPKAPSFMTRPRLSIHNCLTTSTEENDSSCHITNFNRHSLKRKSIKVTKGNKQKSTESLDDNLLALSPNSDMGENKQLCDSYTVDDKNSDKIKEENKVSPITITGAIPKGQRGISGEVKDSKSIENVDIKSTEDNTIIIDNTNSNFEIPVLAEIVISEKDDVLQKEFLNNLDYEKASNADTDTLQATSNNILSPEKLIQEAAKKIKIEIENAIRIKEESKREDIFLKHYELSADIRRRAFLVRDEFIDDDYDSYVKDATLEKLYNMEDINLFEICRCFIRLYMRAVNIAGRKVSYKVKKRRSRKVERNVCQDIEKMFKKQISSCSNKDIWSEIEKIVRSAITDLKGEFKNEIYKKTEEKVDTLMSKLANLLLKADESIENKCERTTVELINKLEKIVR